MSTPPSAKPRSPALSLIAAVAENSTIGLDGGMPWRLSTDMKRFRALTMGKPVLMGRKTFDTLGKPLEGRTNIVITRGGPLPPPTLTAGSVGEGISTALDAAANLGAEEAMVIGGGTVYAATISLADRLYITHVHASPPGDTSFPAIQSTDFEVVSSEDIAPGPRDSHATTFVIYQRRKP